MCMLSCLNFPASGCCLFERRQDILIDNQNPTDIGPIRPVHGMVVLLYQRPSRSADTWHMVGVKGHVRGVKFRLALPEGAPHEVLLKLVSTFLTYQFLS